MSDTIREQIRRVFDTLTRAERQLAGALLENYPMSGLVSITRLAESSGVSTPTVARMVQKLGFAGFPEFQDTLRAELEAQISNPIAKQEHWAGAAPQGHVLNRFTDKVLQNIHQTIANIDPAEFDAGVALLADEARHVFVTGGRITHTLADYFHLHMQVVRAGVTHVNATSNAWPHHLLDLRPGDVLVIYDVRRYENSILRLAEMSEKRGAKIILITDQWQSPIAGHASHAFNCRIDVPSAWDSGVAVMLLTETLIAAVQDLRWSSTSERMRALEEMFDRTRTFRKFV